MKKIKWISLIAAGLFLFHAGNTFAGSKKEAKKQIDALNKKINELGEKSDLQGAIEAAEKALDIASKELGEKSIEAANAMNNVANLYLFSGHPIEAERLYKESILIKVEKDGNDSLDAADGYFNLAAALAMQEKYSEARKLADRTLKIRTQKLGASHAETLKAQKMLSDLWNQSR